MNLAATNMKTSPEDDIESLEIDLLLQGIYRRFGYDFSNYSAKSLRRRLEHVLKIARLNHFSELIHRVLRDPDFFEIVLRQLSINVTEMFRDPDFYRAVRQHIMPMLQTYPYVKFWHAGCATGEEIYSMAILLAEENLLERSILYGTDFNREALDTAAQAIYPIDRMRLYEQNYIAAGGQKSFDNYYHARYEFAKLHDHLIKAVTLSYHNLVTDSVFGEMNVICCRNVLIYFNRQLQNHVLKLFANSLRYGGYLCLGRGESLSFTDVRDAFETVDAEQRIFRKTVP